MRKLIFALLLAAGVAAADDAPQKPPEKACSSPEHRQFDFWVGDWKVYDLADKNKFAGTNHIKLLFNNCVLQENWQSVGGDYAGSSYNIYDAPAGKWHQTWVDSSGSLLDLEGGLKEGSMVLSGTRPARDGSGQVMHRITWTPNPDGTVRQHWEYSKDAGGSWKTLFDGEYRKSGS